MIFLIDIFQMSISINVQLLLIPNLSYYILIFKVSKQKNFQETIMMSIYILFIFIIFFKTPLRKLCYQIFYKCNKYVHLHSNVFGISTSNALAVILVQCF